MNYRLYKQLANGKWKYISGYSSTQDIRYHKDLNKLDEQGVNHKVVRRDNSIVTITKYHAGSTV